VVPIGRIIVIQIAPFAVATGLTLTNQMSVQLLEKAVISQW
jgi:hypothetical protein